MKQLIERARDVKIVFFDIDDTLRRKNSGYLPDSVKLAFEKLKAKGIYTGIATGRNNYGIVPEVKALGADFYVTINGAYVERADETRLYTRPFEKEQVRQIREWLEESGAAYGFVGNHELAVSSWDDLAEAAIRPIYGELPVNPRFDETQEVYQILSLAKNDGDLFLPEELEKTFRKIPWHVYSSDIVAKEVSKAVGVDKVVKSLGITASEVMNFGDGLNDRELFEYAGLSVAMADGHPDIVALSDLTAKPIEADGIYQSLVELGMIE